MKMSNLKPRLLGLAAACCLATSVNAQSVIMSQNYSQYLVSGNTLACNYVNTGITASNSYYRVFKVSDYVTAGYFDVDSINFAVESANSNSLGSIPLVINVYSLSGTTLNLANLTLLGSLSGTIADVNNGGAAFNAPVPTSILGTGTIVVEISAPDFATTGQNFVIGSNNYGQTKPSYWYAPSCQTADIVDLGSLNLTSEMDLLISVYGRGTSIAPPSQPGGFVTSTSSLCAGTTSVTYSVPAVAGMTYNWDYSGVGFSFSPLNTSLTSNTIILDFPTGSASGVLSVTATNANGTSAARSMAVTVNSVGAYVIRSTDTTLASSVSGSSYAWYKNNVAIPGATDSTYKMTAGGNYFVMVNNGTCSGSSDTVNIVDAPGAFVNPMNPVCLPVSGSTDVNYTVPSMAGMDYYDWEYSGTGVNITNNSPNNGNVAGFNFTSAATSGVITVEYIVGFDANSNPVYSLPRRFAIEVDPTPVPTISKGGNVLTASAGFASYAWYKDNIAITGATSANYTITGNGDYYVKVTNAAGCSGSSDVAHITDYTPPLTAINNVVNGNVAFSIYPNPAHNSFTVSVESKLANTEATISITDITGRTLQTQNMRLAAGKQLVPMMIDGLKDGIYFVNVNVDGSKGTQKLIIAK